MSSRNTPSTESASLVAGREAFRLRYCGCDGYTVGVTAALLCIVSAYTGKTPREIGELTGQQLWELCVAGFKRSIKIPVIPESVISNLCVGEKAAIRLGLWLMQDSIPTGETIGDLSDCCPLEPAHSGIIFGEGQLSLAYTIQNGIFEVACV
jgi:hypothetical protein